MFTGRGHHILRYTYAKEWSTTSHLIQKIQLELMKYVDQLEHYFKEEWNAA